MAKHDATTRRCAGTPRRGTKGFTLLELMIVVGIVAILVILAVSSYSFATVKTRRNQAKGCLTQAAQYMERYYTTKMTYNDTVTPDPPKAPSAICDSDTQKYYTVAFVGTPGATTYTINAVPTARQKDPSCGTLSLDNTGTKGATGTAGPTGCW